MNTKFIQKAGSRRASYATFQTQTKRAPKFSRHRIPRIVSCLSVLFAGTLFQTTLAMKNPQCHEYCGSDATISESDSFQQPPPIPLVLRDDGNSNIKPPPMPSAAELERSSHIQAMKQAVQADRERERTEKEALLLMELQSAQMEKNSRRESKPLNRAMKEHILGNQNALGILEDASLKNDAELLEFEFDRGYETLNELNRGYKILSSEKIKRLNRENKHNSVDYTNSRVSIGMRRALRRLEEDKQQKTLNEIFELLVESKGKSTPDIREKKKQMFKDLRSVKYFCYPNILKRCLKSQYEKRKKAIRKEVLAPILGNKLPMTRFVTPPIPDNWVKSDDKGRQNEQCFVPSWSSFARVFEIGASYSSGEEEDIFETRRLFPGADEESFLTRYSPTEEKGKLTDEEL